eukprot:scaffold27386_cov28-Tisochrysis_lutea.AAC.2
MEGTGSGRCTRALLTTQTGANVSSPSAGTLGWASISSALYSPRRASTKEEEDETAAGAR